MGYPQIGGISGRWRMDMETKIEFTQKELQLLYAACMSYGEKMLQISKDIPNERAMVNMLSERAEDSWSLAVKIAENLPG